MQLLMPFVQHCNHTKTSNSPGQQPKSCKRNQTQKHPVHTFGQVCPSTWTCCMRLANANKPQQTDFILLKWPRLGRNGCPGPAAKITAAPSSSPGWVVACSSCTPDRLGVWTSNLHKILRLQQLEHRLEESVLVFRVNFVNC